MMSPEYIDIHSHLNFKEYDSDRDQVIQNLKDNKIWTITVGTELKTSKESVDLAEKHENIYATIGLHPAHDESGEVFNEEDYIELVKNKKVVAIGETGLDYFHIKDEEVRKKQKEQFEKQIEFALKYDKPLMIHCRSAYPDCLDILNSKKREVGEKLRGNFHFFTEPIETAQQCLDVGFTVSFTGPITFAAQYEELVKYVPLERMMAETDAPYAAPAPYRGKRNSPEYVVEIIKKIAEIKGIELETVKKQLILNSFDMFFKEIS
jgi:TatD DNase family protein